MKKRASLLSILSKVHYIIQKYIRKKEKQMYLLFFNEIQLRYYYSAYLI